MCHLDDDGSVTLDRGLVPNQMGPCRGLGRSAAWPIEVHIIVACSSATHRPNVK